MIFTNIIVKCSCYGNGGKAKWKFFYAGIAVKPVVHLMSEYGEDDPTEEYIRAREEEHVVDIKNWVQAQSSGTSNKKSAGSDKRQREPPPWGKLVWDEFDSELKKREYSHQEDCEQVSLARINDKLFHAKIAQALWSKRYWDDSGKHTYNNKRAAK